MGIRSSGSYMGGRGGIYGSGGSTPYSYLFDDNPAALGYSVRELSSTYSGGLVEIRRSSDNAVKDFYPDTDHVLSLSSEDGGGTSLGTWIGANDGFIRTWYDQSGNSNHAIQTSASLQAQIVATGVVVTSNSQPSSDFSGNNYYPFTSAITPLVTFHLTKIDAVSTVNYCIWSNANTKGYYLYGSAASNNFGVFNGGLRNAFVNDTSQHINYLYYNGTDFDLSQDGGAETGVATGANFSVDYLGRNSAGFSINGKTQEVVIYTTDVSASKSDILTQINDFYSVY